MKIMPRGLIKTDDLKFEKSNRKSSFFYGDKTEITLEKGRGKSDVEKFWTGYFPQLLKEKAVIST